MNEREKQLIDASVIGDEARKWLESELGKAVLAIGEREQEASVHKLIAHDPADVEGVRALQHDIKRLDSMKDWFAELITMGEQALAIWRSEKHE